MAYKNIDGLSGTAGNSTNHTLEINGNTVDLPDASFVRDAAIERDGMDLVLDGPQGTITIDGYFAAADTPDLVAPNGETLTPELVNSFARSAPEFAQAQTLNDASPVGAVSEITGEASITRMDGSTEPMTMGTQIFQGDVIETAADGAVNISFIDDTSFAVSEESRLAIDEYVYDPSTQAGSQNFSVLKGVFVFTSGLIGRDDPDDVNIDTPSGSIGIRGTIIAGNVDTGEITVVEGAIVVRDLGGNEMTLATQFETAKINPAGGIENMGRLIANDVSDRFVGVSRVSPTLFSSINDAAAEEAVPDAPKMEQPIEEPTTDIRENFDADGTVDGNNDSEVDGTVDESGNSSGDSVAPVEAPAEETIIKTDTQMKTGTLGMDTMGTMDGKLAMSTMTSDTNTTMTMTTTAGMETVDGDTMAEMTEKFAEMKEAKIQETLEGSADDGLLDGSKMMIDPNAPPPPSTFNQAPVSVRGSGQYSTVPQEFFVTSYNQSISYHFDKEFRDPDGGTLRYRLASGTIADLNTNIGPEGTGWTFNQNNGHLQIFDTGTNTLDSVIRVAAIDGQGATSGFVNYNFDIINANGGTGTLPGTITSNGLTYSSPSGAGDFTTIGPGGYASNNHIYAGDGNDNITLNQGNGNKIYLGDGNNTLTISSANANTGNKVFGGFQNDTINLGDVENHIFTMDGNDTINIDLTAGTTRTDLETTGNGNIRIDGGFNNAINVGNPNGQGDTLRLSGTSGDLDFTQVDNAYIRGIERIDLSAGNHTVTLSLNDVIAMTDHHNTLIIRADSGDQVNFTGAGFAGFSNSGSVMLDDDALSGATTNFEVYTHNGVTLMVENTGATVTGLP